jgi:hypothetical protein
VSPFARAFLFESGDQPRTFSLRLWLSKKKWGSAMFFERDFLKKVPLKLPSKTFDGARRRTQKKEPLSEFFFFFVISLPAG